MIRVLLLTICLSGCAGFSGVTVGDQPIAKVEKAEINPEITALKQQIKDLQIKIETNLKATLKAFEKTEEQNNSVEAGGDSTIITNDPKMIYGIFAGLISIIGLLIRSNAKERKLRMEHQYKLEVMEAKKEDYKRSYQDFLRNKSLDT